MDMERFQQLHEDQSSAWQALKKVWEKMAGADTREFGEVVEEAIRTTRGVKVNAQA